MTAAHRTKAVCVRACLVASVCAATIFEPACGNSDNEYQRKLTCGKGTEARNGVCELALSEAGVAGAEAGDDARSDTGLIPDAGEEPDAGAAGDGGGEDGPADSNDAEEETEAGEIPEDVQDTGEEEAACGSPSGCPDPCPTQEIAVNCSQDCGGPTASCQPSGQCVTAALPPLSKAEQFPLIMRTPSLQQADPECVKKCGAGDTVYSLEFGIENDIQHNGPQYVKVSVGEPWRLYATINPPAAVCQTLGSWYSNCILIDYDNVTPYWGIGVAVATTDPTAPARNVTVELVSSYTASCP